MPEPLKVYQIDPEMQTIADKLGDDSWKRLEQISAMSFNDEEASYQEAGTILSSVSDGLRLALLANGQPIWVIHAREDKAEVHVFIGERVDVLGKLRAVTIMEP